jgi:tetratricopeptide (TPR) repeat protein
MGSPYWQRLQLDAGVLRESNTMTQEAPLAQAEQLLAAARQAGDLRAQAGALTDLGILVYQGGDPPRAAALLEEALGLARRGADRAREADILCQLAVVFVAAGRPERGPELLSAALATARALADPIAEKTALDHLGIVRTALRDHRAARDAYGQALAVARAVGDRPHEADLLWWLAIQHAALDERDQAITLAEEAIDLFGRLGNPHVGVLTDHLRRYRAGETGVVLDRADLGRPVVVSPAAPAPRRVLTGPGLLHMAITAVKAAAQFVASGATTVSQQARQQRLGVCATCPQHTGLRCRACGCFTRVKTWLPHERCPLGKWPE